MSVPLRWVLFDSSLTGTFFAEICWLINILSSWLTMDLRSIFLTRARVGASAIQVYPVQAVGTHKNRCTTVAKAEENKTRKIAWTRSCPAKRSFAVES